MKDRQEIPKQNTQGVSENEGSVDKNIKIKNIFTESV